MTPSRSGRQKERATEVSKGVLQSIGKYLTVPKAGIEFGISRTINGCDKTR